MIKKKSSLGIISGPGGDPPKRFRQMLKRLEHFDEFLDWSESNAFSRTLAEEIAVLADAKIDPRKGLELLIEFYRTDGTVLNSCDDSDGTVGDVYGNDACDLFVRYAAAYSDKRWIADAVMELYRKDDFGIRGELLHRAAEYLPFDILRAMSETMWREASSQKSERGKMHFFLAVEEIARRLEDAPLFEKARIAWSGEKPGTAACIDIAQAYFDAHDASTALQWLRKISGGDDFQAEERDDLLFSVFAELGMTKEQSEVAWRIFRRHRSPESLDALLSTIGEHHRNRIIEEEADLLLQRKELEYRDVSFLIHVGEVEKAEGLVLSHYEQLDGAMYYDILPLAEAFERHKRFLTSTLLHRSLVDSIVGRGISKYYHHAVKYMKHLDLVASLVSDWRGFQSQDEYMAQLKKVHAKKSSLWERLGLNLSSKKATKKRNDVW